MFLFLESYLVEPYLVLLVDNLTTKRAWQFQLSIAFYPI